MNARSAVLLAVAALLLLSVPSAAAHGPDPTLSGGLFNQNQALEFRWRSGSEPAGAVRNAILAAAADNNASRASKSVTFAYDSTAPNLIGYGTGTCGVNGLGCFTRTAPTGFTMWLREHGRVFDWGTLRWCQMQASPTNGCYDAETIALDEFGHIQVLDHHVNYSDDRDYTQAVVQTFSRTRPSAGWNIDSYFRGWNGLQVSFGKFFLNSFIISGLSVIGNVMTCSLAAYAFARLEFPGRRFWFAMMLMTLMLP